MLPRIKFSLRTVFLALVLGAILMTLVRRQLEYMSIRREFKDMHQASEAYMLGYQRSKSETYGGAKPVKFEKGISPVLRPLLDRIEGPIPKELIQYLSTAVPTEDYQSYCHTFLSADSIARDNGIDGYPCFDAGYFAFANESGTCVAVSLKDSKVYSSAEGFETYNTELEADSIKQFIESSRQTWRVQAESDY